jgi:5'-nucleotidase
MTKVNMEAPVVLVDMDGVLADFDQEIVNRLRARHPHIPILADRTNFYFSHDYPEHADVIRAMSDEEGFFDSLPMVNGALDGWQRILDGGYLPRICSSPIRTNPHSKKEKLGWLEKNFAPVFGSWVVEQAIITREKEKYPGIALIDDRPEINNAAKAAWQHIIFDHPYNQDSLQPRLYGWSDGNLLQLLRAAEIQLS